MKRRDITARLRAMLLFGTVLIIGAAGCSDRLIPPDPGSPDLSREHLLYYNDLADLALDSSSSLFESQIIAVRTDGTSRRTIVNGFIASSPRGGRIAFYSGGRLGAPGLYVANEDGSSPTLLVPETDREHIWPNLITLSPDGRTVAYITDDGASEQSTLHIRSANRVVTEAIGPTAIDYTPMCPPVFSRDGRYVATITYTRDLFEQSILVVGVEDGSVRDLGLSLSSMSFYAMFTAPFDWSPDGSKIVFVGATDLAADLMRIDINTGRVDTLTRDSIIEDTPRYIGGSGQILYVGADPLEFSGSNLFVRDLAGGRRQLTHDADGFKLGLALSDDGRYAAYCETASPAPEPTAPIRVFDIARQLPGARVGSSIFALWRQ